MIKKLHYIKEDYSGDIEKYCIESYSKLYPDFEFMAWKPGSSPLRILYDHGGLFIGPNILALNRIPDSYFEKSFLVFNNSFITDYPNIHTCCYASEEKDEIYLEFMEKGVSKVLEQEGYSGSFDVKTKGCDIKLNRLNIWNRIKFGGFDKLLLNIYDSDAYLLDTNIRLDVLSGWNVHYVIINEDTSSNSIHALCESFFNQEYKDGSKHMLLLVCNDMKRDLINRMGELINYRNIYENKKADIILVGDGIDEKRLNNILIEYIGRKFDGLKSCEKI